MQLLSDVQPWGVSPVLWVVLGITAELHRRATGAELTVTSLRRIHSRAPSKHAPPWPGLCEAADVRRWALDDKGMADTFARELKARFLAAVGVVLEPEWLSARELAARGGRDAVQPHLHLQVQGPGWPTLL